MMLAPILEILSDLARLGMFAIFLIAAIASRRDPDKGLVFVGLGVLIILS